MKCVMVIDRDLPLGLIANTAAVLAVSIGEKVAGMVGEDVADGDGSVHRGITRVPISMLTGDGELIRTLRRRLAENPQEGIFYVDFCDVAQRSKKYEDYRAELARTSEAELGYLGLAVYGPRKSLDRLTGCLSLLR